MSQKQSDGADALGVALLLGGSILAAVAFGLLFGTGGALFIVAIVLILLGLAAV